MRVEGSDGWLPRAVHIFVLTSFAVAQPIFDLLGKNTTFFVAHGATPVQMWIFTAGVLLLPALAIVAIITMVSSVWSRLGRWAQATAAGGLFALALVPPLVRGLYLNSLLIPLLMLAIVVGSVVYARFAWAKQYLSWGLVAPLAFLVLFVIFSPAFALFFPSPHAAPLDVQVQQETPVLVLLFDEMALGLILTPEGEIDERRFPNFARLADQATWYPNATTVADYTNLAVPALLTGTMPEADALPTDHQKNLFTLLEKSYDIRAEGYIHHLCPPWICKAAIAEADEGALLRDTLVVYLHSVLPDSLRSRFLPSLDGRWAGFLGAGEEDAAAEAVAERLREGLPLDAEMLRALAGRQRDDDVTSFERMLAQLPDEQGGGRDLWYLHLGVPHVPYLYLPDERFYFTHRDIPGLFEEKDSLWGDDLDLIHQALQRLMLQTQFVDHLLGRMLDRLEGSPLYSDAMLVVTADHGVAFEPGRFRRTLTAATLDQILPIPLFVKYPGQEAGSVDERPAEINDVLPTIADVLEVELPWDAAGTSLLGAVDATQRYAWSQKDGEIYEVPSDLDVTTLSRTIRQEFGGWGGRYDLYAPATYLEMIGRSPRMPDADDSLAMSFELNDPPLYENVDPDSGFVPAFVTGTLRGPDAKAHMPLLLAVNGIAAGTGVSYLQGSELGFSGMVSPLLFDNGRNQIDLYAIGSDGRLSPIQKIE